MFVCRMPWLWKGPQWSRLLKGRKLQPHRCRFAINCAVDGVLTQAPDADGVQTAPSGPKVKKPKIDVMGPYRAFCAQARKDGFSIAQAAAAWKESAVRRALVEQMTDAQRRKGKFVL